MIHLLTYQDPDIWWLHTKCKDGEMFVSTMPWTRISNKYLNLIFLSKQIKEKTRHERRITENYEVFGDDGNYYQDKKNDMNVVVNTDTSGSVTVTISNARKDESIEEENQQKILINDDKVFQHDHYLENQILLKEVRDLLISQKLETNNKENELRFTEEFKKHNLSELIQNLDELKNEFGGKINKSGDDIGDTGFFGILKTRSRVYPMVWGGAGLKMAQNTSIIQQHLASPNRTKNMLLQEFAKKPSHHFNLPVNTSSGGNKMIRIFQRGKERDQKNLSLPFKSNGLPILQNIKTNTTIPKLSHHVLGKP